MCFDNRITFILNIMTDKYKVTLLGVTKGGAFGQLLRLAVYVGH